MWAILGFLGYSAFCYWVVCRGGADVMEGWKSFFVIDWFAATLTAAQLRFYVAVSWLVSLVATAAGLLSG